MKTLRMGLAAALFTIVISSFATTGNIYAIDVPANLAENIKKQDKSAGAAIKEDKAKIAREREAIIEDLRKIKEAKKAGDKAMVEQLNQDIKARKATISAIKDDIGTRTGSRIDMGASSHRK